jgi:uncharacterized membrane protein (DUF2068 family)
VPRTAVKTSRPFKKSKQRESAAGLILIGLFKLAKSLALIAVGIGALRFLHRDLAQSVAHWVSVLRVDPDNRFIHPILAKLFSVTPRQLRELSAGTFFYAALLGIEGIGLLLRKRWAEYFTIITTGALLPLEGYELARHVTMAKVIVLLVNAAIVWYLVVQVRARRR